ncbi:MAG: hypothetical protein IJF83_07150 [Methanobrevibacter sp.]|nr:hypothetical protein [Methanobrevibacter sp.]
MILPPQSRLLVFEEMEYKGKLGQTYKLLCFDIYKDYLLYILSLGSHPTAYIVLDEDDKLYGLNMDELDSIPDLYCHGGFTYSKNTLTVPGYSYVNEHEKKWVIGWDYGHHRDWTNLLPEDIQLEFGSKKWTTREILNECREVIDMIIEYNKKMEALD